MSSMLHKMKKEIKKRNKEELPTEMYNNLLGSFLISLKIWGLMPLNDKELKRFYFDEKERWLNNEVDEDNWMKDIAKKLEVNIPYGKIAEVVSDYNVLIAPILKDEDGKYNVLPLRSDGFKGVTLLTGKVYPIVGKKKVEVEEMFKENK